jgi:hypothetical protein
MWKSALGAAALSLLALPALAAGGAVCRAGQGCTCVTMDMGLLPVLAGSDVLGTIAPTETIVLDRTTNTTYTTRQSPQAVHEAYGGRGACPVSEPPAEIVPRDGVWQWRTLGETTRDCPPMLAGMLAANRIETLSQRVAWRGGFHPDRLAESLPRPEMGGTTPYIWRRIGPNRWLSDNIRSRSCGEGTCAEIALALTMGPVTPERLTGLLSLRSRVEGGPTAVLARFGMADCNVRLRYEIRRIAD